MGEHMGQQRVWSWVRGLAMLAALTSMSVVPATAQLAPGLHSFGFVFDSQFRDYDLRVPTGYDGTVPLPLVIDFHGAGSNKTQERLVSGFQAQAEVSSFLVAYPTGLFNTWNAGVCCGGAAANNIDDVGFTRALVDQVAQQARVDRRRVYSTGLSNGGFMTHRLACEADDLIAAFAPSAAFIGVSPCQPARPVPVQMFMGLTDLTVPYATAAPSFAFWRDNGQCAGATPDQTVVTGAAFCETYNQCADDIEVGMCSVTANPLFGGHVLYANDDIPIAQTAWQFMSRYALAPALDNFKCYKVKDRKAPKFVGTTVQIADQFGINDGTFGVAKPFLLCTPTNVNGEGIKHPADHLTCYKIKGPELAPQDGPRVDAPNALGATELAMKKPALLCLPSTKTILP
jgi:polyhydroxybutyrate depolymerase